MHDGIYSVVLTDGLGFLVGKFREHKSVSHSGAVYGHSASLVFLPEPKIGVIILANEDVVNARIQKLANLALSLMLEVKLGEGPPTAPADRGALAEGDHPSA